MLSSLQIVYSNLHNSSVFLLYVYIYIYIYIYREFNEIIVLSLEFRNFYSLYVKHFFLNFDVKRLSYESEIAARNTLTRVL